MSTARVVSPTVLLALGAGLSKSDFVVTAATAAAAIVALLLARAVAVRVYARMRGPEETR